MQGSKLEQEQAYFLTFCIEQFKHKKNADGLTIKNLFDKTGVSSYLVENFDVLHTQGKDWILDDIDSYIKNRIEQK